MTAPQSPVEPSSPSPRIWRRFRLPPGALPRFAQHAGVLSIVVLMGAIMLLTSSLTPQKLPEPAPAASTDAGQQTSIQEWGRRFREQEDRINRERAELEVAKRALAQRTESPTREPWTEATPPATPSPAPPDERAAREARALFADNVAFRRVESPRAAAPPDASQTPAPAPSGTRETPVPLGRHRLLEGQFVETILTNRLDGTFAGPVNCLVTSPVYARDSETLLIPAGARFLGAVKPVTEMNQRRLAVAFHRLLLPNGTTIPLDQAPGLNHIGETALRDQVSQHYWQMFGATAAVGALAGLSMAQTRYGLDTSNAGDVYRQGVSTSLGSASTRILERYLNQLPTLTIREGHPVLVYLTADLDLPAYDETAPAVEAPREF